MLLLVVLSMLVLFMLVGTAFLMSSSQQGKNAANSAKLHRVGNPPTKDLDSALMQVLRDSDNAHSAIRYHSLLRDLYGTDGFQGVVYSPDPGLAFDPLIPAQQVTRYAAAVAGTVDQQLGPTRGQFVDIYVRALGWNPSTNKSLNDPLTSVDESAALLQPDKRHVVKVDNNVFGRPQLYALPLAKGYFNGCVLTITSGPAAGQTARILDYDYVSEIPPTSGTVVTRLFRLRVMNFQRADGQPLQIGTRQPELADLAGASFLVNGRAFAGTGVGYNPLATPGQPRLNALQLFPTSSSEALGGEIALLPNAVYFNPRNAWNIMAAAPGVIDPFAMPIPVASLVKLNDVSPKVPFFNYPAFGGPGDVNESYDAADFQNMFLALLTVTPRDEGRVVTDQGTFSVEEFRANPTSHGTFLRFDVDDVALPSFHRPDLLNFWNHRLFNSSVLQSAISDDAQRALAILDPYPNGTLRTGLDPAAAALITAVKRQASLRPLREDNPKFDGGNSLSVPTNILSNGLVVGGSITYPHASIVGPWDVDNDNDGVRDSIWVDIGNPVQQAEDGTRYKALVAYLIVDLDSRLNVNAHGFADDINPPALALSYDLNGNAQTGAAAKNLAGAANSNGLPQGLGYGSAEISLRPLFPAPLDAGGNAIAGNRTEGIGSIDDYAAILIGRLELDGGGIPGKYGYITTESFLANQTYPERATPGTNYKYLLNNAMVTGEQAVPDLASQLKFFNYPWAITQASAFGTPPDLFARYPLGLDYDGQPVYEVINDRNESNNTLPRPLLTDSPYELNLDSAQRRDSWATTTNPIFATAADEFSQSLVQSDDAAFSASDLEKVLRAWDADAGTLPSRLWDAVNAFDPLKLLNVQYGDPVRVRNTALTAFGAASNSELLTTAQQIAGINRRLVTTDSFDLPVVGRQMPSYIPELGADGAPGRSNIDDDPDGPGPLTNNGTKDDAAEIGAPGSDDFQALTGTKYSAGTLIDVLRYRIQRDRISRALAPFDLTVPAQKLAFDSLTSQLAFQELAPDLVAGKRMDINRPFGDGRDNNNDGVVDDPLEAGEPFLDANSNGKCDPNERFLDLNGSGRYEGPSDVLWQGLTAEPIAFDYTNGVGEPIYNGALSGGVRNLEAHGRQVFARQLYCLMLLLVDENYIAPWDETDPQVMTWVEAERKKLTSATPPVGAAEADFIVKRKLTRRAIAQWAVNCVDVRDSDVIMTPFEYDENPWDGWGCPDANGVNIPLDGDVATDEGKGELIDWTAIPPNDAGGPKQLTTVAAAAVPPPVNQTRGVVWGAERPELLITETLATHDRRTEDLKSNDPNGHGEMKHYQTDRSRGSSGSGPYQDDDPDQGLRPRGSLFVEVHNPWSSNGQYPSELYSRVNSSLAANDPNRLVRSNGVQLDRLSDFAVDGNGNLTLQPSNAASGVKRSPVWRLIVVEEWPDSRNSDQIDDARLDRSIPTTPPEPTAYKKQASAVKAWTPTAAAPYPPFRPTDPDFDATFDAGFVPRQKGLGKNVFEVQYPYIEREFYFTTDKSPAMPAAQSITLKDQTPDYDYSAGSFKLRIPQRVVDIKYPSANLNFKPGYLQRFIPVQLETNVAIPIAPILPGRYGVIGTAGTKYSTTEQTYTTTIGRFDMGTASWNTDDTMHNPVETRRIELRPNADPNIQQLVVATNGGDPKDVMHPSLDSMGNKQYDPTTQEIGRDNELVNDKGVVKNIYLDASGNPAANYYEPCVAIPVEGMSVSEPAWGWGPREFEAAQEEAALKGGAPNYFQFKPTANNKYEGRYFGGAGSANKTSYDKPLDGHLQHPIALELVRNGTTANYRTVHLQRLANPLLPWNPPPLLADGKTKNPDHRANLPINPYRTVDTASVDLTAFNGTTSAEANYPVAASDAQNKLLQWRPWETTEVNKYLGKYAQDQQVWHFRSSERGAWARLNVLGAAAAPAVSPPQRVLWAQEPAMVKFKPAAAADLFDLITVRQMTMRAAEVDSGVTLPPKAGPVSKINHADMVMEHTLGFGNKSFGLLYDKQGAKLVAPTAAAVGAPAPADYVWDLDSKTATIDARIQVDSTNPWFAWNNRPFVSAEELLNVPAASQATMLRMYTTIDPKSQTPVNGYGLAALGTPLAPPVANAVRWSVMHAPFGQMANMFAVSALAPGTVASVPADVVRNAGVPVLDANGHVQPYGAPNFYRIFDYLQVPSRFVGAETLLNAETFNDNPPVTDVLDDIASPNDPRYAFQPPFNKVSRERDPGRVNLNTVTGRRIGPTATSAAQIWSEVYDGIMHRVHDGDPANAPLSHFGPAWRDIVISRKGYAQFNAGSPTPIEKLAPAAAPDTQEFGLNNEFPSIISNPFRSADAGDLVPLAKMMMPGVQASFLRSHHFNRGDDRLWGAASGNVRAAGFGDDQLVGAGESGVPLLSASLGNPNVPAPWFDADRNPYNLYQPMTRLGNLVTERSNVFAVWITVGYFEVEPAPNWNDPDNAQRQVVRQRFGGTLNDADAATIAGLALYNRAYPDGYMLGRELGSDTGNITRPRGFYIIDRTEAVGFKPGEDLNVEKAIRLRRRIE